MSESLSIVDFYCNTARVLSFDRELPFGRLSQEKKKKRPQWAHETEVERSAGKKLLCCSTKARNRRYEFSRQLYVTLFVTDASLSAGELDGEKYAHRVEHRRGAQVSCTLCCTYY